MSTYQLRTFGDLVNAIREEIQIQASDTTALNRIRRDLNIIYQEVVGRKNWWWLQGHTTVQLPVYSSTGTASVAVGSASITLTSAPLGISRKGYKFAIDGFDEIYTIESHTAGATSLKLDREFTGATNTTATYKIWTDRVPLPVDCKETIRAWHDYHSNPLECVGLNEFRRISGQGPRSQGKPLYYATADFIDAAQTSSIESLPALSTRASSGVVKTLVFASTLPSSVTDAVDAGAPYRIRISDAGEPSYNGDFLINTASGTTITYISPIATQESATADTSLTVESLNQESATSRYRELFLFPAIDTGRTSIHVDYLKRALDLTNDSDEPAMPVEDRSVLLYGALERAWRRHRNKEESDTNGALYRDKLAQMASKLQDTFEKPRLKPSTAYLSTKRSIPNSRRLDATIPGLNGGGASGAIVKGTPNSVTIFNSLGETEGSSVTTTQLNTLLGIDSNVQDQLDDKADLGATLSASKAVVTDSSGNLVTATATTTEINYLAGVTSAIQTQLDSKLTSVGALTPDTALQANGAGAIASSSVTATELGYVSGVTSAIQTQLDAKALDSDLDAHTGASSGAHAASAISNTPSGNLASTDVQAALNELQTDIDTRATSAALTAHTGASSGAHAASAISNTPSGNLAASDVQTALNELQTDVDTRATSSALTTHTSASSGVHGVTGSVVGTSDAQTLTNKTLAVTSNSITATTGKAAQFNASTGALEAASVTTTELGYVAGVTSAIQTQIDSKPTKGTINASKALVSDASSNVVSSSVTSTELGYVSGVTSAIQTQINTKADSSTLTTHTSASSGVHGVTGSVVGTTDTQTLSNKTLSDALTVAQVSTPSNPSSGYNKFYAKSDGKLYTLTSAGAESAVGSGGQGGINLIALDTSWGITKTTNSDAETSVGDWVAYADAAGTSPVDMTGGSPNTTIARDTSSPLNGAAHFTMTVSSGATRQGEGVSCTANVPPAYRGKTVSFQFPFTATGTIVDGDFSLFAYDVTNSTVITPYAAGKILGSSGTAIATFPIPTTCTQLRVGIHIARASNTGAVTLKFDDVKLTVDTPALGLAGSDWADYSLTIGGSTTAPTQGSGATKNARWRRVGDSIEIDFEYIQTAAGSAGSGTYLFPLPSGLTADTTKVRIATVANGADGSNLGPAKISDTGTNAASGVNGHVTLYNSTNLMISYVNGSTNANGVVGSGFTLGNTTIYYSFRAVIPISGWSSNVTMSQSSTFKISSYLANGTRVTTTPANLGEYRTQYRASSSSATLTDVAPTAAPNATDGMRIYGNVPWNAAGTSGQIAVYNIFIGKNKNYRLEFYSSAGRTGTVAVGGMVSGVTEYGAQTSYDPTTGVLTVNAGYIVSGSNTTRFLGVQTGTINSSVTDGYFDIIVSENALAVGAQAPRSEVWLTGANGYGSTNTKIRRFSTTQRNIGQDITYSDSATAGASFIINSDGLYSITYVDSFTGGSFVGISRNSSQLTTNVESINQGDVVAIQQTSGVNAIGSAPATLILYAGDVIRPHTEGTAVGTGSPQMFRITKVSN
jgi:hypothetical protein